MTTRFIVYYYLCGISVAESQMFLCAKRPQLRRARRNGCFRRLDFCTVRIYKNGRELIYCDFPLYRLERKKKEKSVITIIIL